MILNQLGLGIILQAKNMVSKNANRARRSLVKLEKAAKKSSSGIKADTDKIAAAMDKMRSSMIVGGALIGAGVAMAAPFLLMARAASKSEQRLKDVKTLFLDVGEVVAEQLSRMLRTEALGIAGKTLQSIEDIETATYDMASAMQASGQATKDSAEQARAALLPTALLADAGMGNMEQATNAVTAALLTFGQRMPESMTPVEKAWKIANQFSAAIASAKTKLPALSSALAYAAPSANALGLSLSETLAAIGMMQTAGIEATRAGTNFAAFLRETTNLQNKFGESVNVSTMSWKEFDEALSTGAVKSTGKATDRVKQLANQLKVDVVGETGHLKAVPDIIEAIEKRFNITNENTTKTMRKSAAAAQDGKASFQAMGLSAEDASALQKMFGDEGSRFISIALGQSQVLRARTKAIEADNKLVDRARVRAEGLNGQMFLAKERFKAVAIEAGDHLLPALTDLVRMLTPMLESLRDFVKMHPTATKWIAFTGVVGGALLALAGTLTMVIAGFRVLSVIGVFGSITTGIGGIKAAVTGLTASLAANPLIAAILSIGAAVYAAHKLYQGLIRPALFSDNSGHADIHKSINAQVKLNKWTSGQTDSMGRNIAGGFKTATAGLGTQFGNDMADALNEAQKRGTAHVDEAERRAARLSPDYWKPLIASGSLMQRLAGEQLKKQWERLQPRTFSQVTGGVNAGAYSGIINNLLDMFIPRSNPIAGEYYKGASHEVGQYVEPPDFKINKHYSTEGLPYKDISTHTYYINLHGNNERRLADELEKKIKDKQRRGANGRVGHPWSAVPKVEY